MCVFKRDSPTLYGVYIAISTMNCNAVEGKQTLISMFSQMLEKRKFIFEQEAEDFVPITTSEYEDLIKNTGEQITAPSFEMLELKKTGFFFPHHRVKRKIIDIKIPGEKLPCTKNYQASKTMGPGTIYFFCVQHEKCIGFIVLDKPESLRIISHTLLTRFELMPELVLYDNGCNLNEYVLNRFPKSFKNTRIMVDGFHYNSHINCSPSYDASAHPEITREINTSLLEQKNSRFAKMKWTSPFLKLDTFMSKLRYSAMVINK